MLYRTQTPRRGAVQQLLTAAAVPAAGLCGGYALGRETTELPQYLLGGLAASVPVLILLLFLANVRPPTALLGLVGVVAGSLSLAVVGTQAVVPVALGLGCVVVAGALLKSLGRAAPRDLVWGLVLGYGCLAWIVELSIVLHNL